MTTVQYGINLAERHDDHINRANLLAELGKLNWHRGEMHRSVKCFEEAIETIQLVDEYPNWLLANMHAYLARTFIQLENHECVIEQLKTAQGLLDNETEKSI